MEDNMEDARDFIPPALGDVDITFANSITPYQPDIIVWGDNIGAKIGSIVIIFRPGGRERKKEKDQ